MGTNGRQLAAEPLVLTLSGVFLFFREFLVGTNGLEPSTSRLSGVRSNHLSYAPVLVEIKGIEPLTPCLQSRCSPS